LQTTYLVSFKIVNKFEEKNKKLKNNKKGETGATEINNSVLLWLLNKKEII